MDVKITQLPSGSALDNSDIFPFVSGSATTPETKFIRKDNLRDSLFSWVSYTPTWTAFSGTPTIGNGTITGKYFRIGKLIVAHFAMVFGSSTNFDSSTIWYLSTPFTANTRMFGITNGEQASTAKKYLTQCRVEAGDPRIVVGMVNDSSSWFGYNIPITWADGDKITCQISYSVA